MEIKLNTTVQCLECVTRHTNTSVNETCITKDYEEVVQKMEIPLYIYILTLVLNGAIFLIGTIGNALVIIVVLIYRDVRTPTNMFC